MTDTPSGKPNVLVLPGPTLYHRLFNAETDARLRNLADVTFNDRDENWTSQYLAERIGPYDGLVTCWGSPPITDAVLDAAPNLRVIAHSAGSVKGIIKENVLERGIKVSSASIAMAPAVAEFSLILTFLGLRPIHEYDFGMRRAVRQWDAQEEFGVGWEIAASRIGVVGAGMVGRLYIAKANALGAEVCVYDPYLTKEAASELGATKLGLAELFEICPTIVIHAPTTPETHHMIGAPELALMPDNGYLVNTARSWVVDQAALLAELQSGRIRAALDVFDEEPLSLDHPFRSLPNVLLTPHTAGATMQTRDRQGECAVRDLENAFAGRPLAHEVTLERYAILA
ncbi:MAG: hydroxyacid dehydrogenase [Chloroflexota bacterium]|nr:hydroxyacid dehydrogenase [Chloroflexota bacterium]